MIQKSKTKSRTDFARCPKCKESTFHAKSPAQAVTYRKQVVICFTFMGLSIFIAIAKVYMAYAVLEQAGVGQDTAYRNLMMFGTAFVVAVLCLPLFLFVKAVKVYCKVCGTENSLAILK